MKRLNFRSVLVSIIALSSLIPATAQANSINLSENWYIKITNFSLQGGGELPLPLTINLTALSLPGSYQGSSTQIVEPKLQDQVSGNPNYYNTLLFDFHAGSVTTADKAWFYPACTVGSIWSGTMSFNWQIYSNDPSILFGVSSDEQTWWTAPSGSSYRSGSASFYVSTSGEGAAPPEFVVSFASVPEPTSLLTVMMFTVGFICRRRRTH